VLFGIDKAIKYAINAQMYAATFVWVLNADKYEAMAPAQRQVIDNHCTTEWAVRFASPWADFEAAGHEKIAAEPGHEIVNLTPAELNQWRQATSPLREAWAGGVKKTGGNPDAIAKAFHQSLVQNNAAEP
jgi:TRAP-type C4-dicarboxylate transport system substrate-binding protein